LEGLSLSPSPDLSQTSQKLTGLFIDFQAAGHLNEVHKIPFKLLSAEGPYESYFLVLVIVSGMMSVPALADSVILETVTFVPGATGGVGLRDEDVFWCRVFTQQYRSIHT